MSERIDRFDYFFIVLFIVSLVITSFLMDNSTAKFCFCLASGQCVTSDIGSDFVEEKNNPYDIKGSFLVLRELQKERGQNIKTSCESYLRFDPKVTIVLFEKDYFPVFDSKPDCYCLNDGRCIIAIRGLTIDLEEFFEAVNKADAIERIPERSCESFDSFVPSETRIFYESGIK